MHIDITNGVPDVDWKALGTLFLLYTFLLEIVQGKLYFLLHHEKKYRILQYSLASFFYDSVLSHIWFEMFQQSAQVPGRNQVTI